MTTTELKKNKKRARRNTLECPECSSADVNRSRVSEYPEDESYDDYKHSCVDCRHVWIN